MTKFIAIIIHQMCLRTQSLETCNHSECIFFSNMLQTSYQAIATRMLESLTSLSVNRQLLLAPWHYSPILSADKKENLKSIRQKIKLDCSVPSHPFLPDRSCEFKLISIDAVNTQVFKEKGFSLKFQVQNSKNDKVQVNEIFRVRLYSSESSPKLLRMNISCKKIMRGTLESLMDDKGVVVFENIVINEVSSHYVNESFSLVVLCENSNVQPFVLENLRVRARNFHKKGNSHKKLVDN